MKSEAATINNSKNNSENNIKENKKNKEFFLNLVAFFLICACYIVTPYFAKIFERFYPTIGYGGMEVGYYELSVALLYILEIVVCTKVFKMKFAFDLFKENEKSKQVLNARTMIILEAIVFASILIISYQIDFQIKPIYDMGIKITGYLLIKILFDWLRIAVKCLMMVMLIHLGQNAIESLVPPKKIQIPYGGIILMLTLGLFDFVVLNAPLRVTYLILNLVFGIIYLLTKRNIKKTYFLTFVIYFL